MTILAAKTGETREGGEASKAGASAFDRLLDSLSERGDSVHAHIDESWMQGRTAYGGISAAVALSASMTRHRVEWPLRSAQISFVGPVGGDCRVATRVLRHSKSSLFVSAEVMSEAGFGTAALFVFSAERDSHIDHDRLTMPTVPPPESLEPVREHKARPAFTRHFDMRPVTGPRFAHGLNHAHFLAWVRFIEEPQSHAGTAALLALGDALPPSAMALFRRFGPVSTTNWMVNMLTATPQTKDGWWLLSAKSDYARAGFSAQNMMLWNRAGQVIAHCSQGVAIYC